MFKLQKSQSIAQDQHLAHRNEKEAHNQGLLFHFAEREGLNTWKLFGNGY
jgi:hypothetical protein